MDGLLAISRRIDRMNRWIGQKVFWLMLALIFIGALTTLLRKTGQILRVTLVTNAFLEIQWYFYSLIFLFGAAYTLQENGHVRVDILYDRMSPRKRAWVNLIGSILYCLPLALVILWYTFVAARISAGQWEASPDGGGLPRWPIKVAVPIAFLLLALQGVSEAIKSLHVICGGKPMESEPESQPEVA